MLLFNFILSCIAEFSYWPISWQKIVLCLVSAAETDLLGVVISNHTL